MDCESLTCSHRWSFTIRHSSSRGGCSIVYFVDKWCFNERHYYIGGQAFKKGFNSGMYSTIADEVIRPSRQVRIPILPHPPSLGGQNRHGYHEEMCLVIVFSSCHVMSCHGRRCMIIQGPAVPNFVGQYDPTSHHRTKLKSKPPKRHKIKFIYTGRFQSLCLFIFAMVLLLVPVNLLVVLVEEIYLIAGWRGVWHGKSAHRCTPLI